MTSSDLERRDARTHFPADLYTYMYIRLYYVTYSDQILHRNACGEGYICGVTNEQSTF